MLLGIVSAALCGFALAHPGHPGHSHGLAPVHANPLKPALLKFPLSAVALDPTSALFESQARNARYMLSLDSARLLCLFTAAANLTGTWEAPTCAPYSHPGYYGHYFGHYLSGMGIYLENAGGSPMGVALAAKLDGLLDAMAAVQAAWAAVGQPGYFFPRSPIAFDALESNTQKCDPCVPYYVYHKSLAGLIDIAERLGSAKARALATGMGDWVVQRVTGVLAKGGQAQWQMVLNTEWGGMNDGLNNLYRLTGDARYLATASAFNHWSWTSPLAVHSDQLQNFHANTHIPEILGDLNGFALTQNATQAAIVDNFLDILLTNHSWATGGSNDHEWWAPPRTMYKQLNADTEETCTQYNIIKVTSGKGLVTGDPQWFDWAEKQLLNGMLGNQNLQGQWADSNSTGFHYMLPLGGGGLRKPWGDASEGFPCCWGTSTEQFAGRHLELPFARSPDGNSLYVSLFMPLTLTWPQDVYLPSPNAGVTVAQEAGFPISTAFSTRLTLGGALGVFTNLSLHIRVPGWATGGNAIAVNGAPLPGPITPGTYYTVSMALGAWKAGDVIEAYFPPPLIWEPITDDSPEAVGVGALRFGPILLAGLNVTADRIPDSPWRTPDAFVQRNSTDPSKLRFTLTCRAVDACNPDRPSSFELAPLYEIKDEAYTVYWRAGPSPQPAHYTGNVTLLVPGGEENWEGHGGFSSGAVLRSGNPGEVSVAAPRAAPLSLNALPHHPFSPSPAGEHGLPGHLHSGRAARNQGGVLHLSVQCWLWPRWQGEGLKLYSGTCQRLQHR